MISIVTKATIENSRKLSGNANEVIENATEVIENATT